MPDQDNCVVQIRNAILVAAERAEASINADQYNPSGKWAEIVLTLATALEKVPR